MVPCCETTLLALSVTIEVFVCHCVSVRMSSVQHRTKVWSRLLMTSQPHFNQSNHEENLWLSVKSYPSLLHDNATPFCFSKLSHYFVELMMHVGPYAFMDYEVCSYTISPNFCLFISTNKKTKVWAKQ